ncbi:DUF2845 domain-containing protein [Pseudomonas sp. DC3000-4b1]|uniref:DUF2845 domain-containing protein n=1 Tax=unclassified Pseudomonas TaxID=196821 RepID=UPI003CF1EDFC
MWPKILVVLSVLGVPSIQAADRCGRHLVNLYTSLDAIIQTCGQPVAHASQGPALRADGGPRKGPGKTDVLVYGPSGGAWQYMLFQNDQLVRIETRRRPPDGDLLKW